MRVVDLARDFGDEVAANVRAEMARQRVTQQDLIERTGWSQPRISRRLTGAVAFDVAELAIVARALGKAPAELLPAPIEDAA
jgi:transcriptional regulator with XRE-family HTH domain